MPTYEYKREDGSIFEITQSINDKTLTTCPTTGQPVKRIISGGGGVVYKGSGWYITDYKNGNNNNGDTKPVEQKEPAAKVDKPEKTEKKPKQES